jgi:hypothetical protein
MPSFHVEVTHQLGAAEAQRRLENFVADVQQRFADRVSEVSGAWNANVLDFSMKSFGMTFSGKIFVEDDRVRVEGQMPFAAIAFRGRIEQEIAQALTQVLNSSQ